MLLPKKLWVVVALAFCLLSAPAWASRTDDKAADGKKKASLRLTKTKHAERYFWSQSVVDVSLAPKKGRVDEKASRSHALLAGLPPGLETRDFGMRGYEKTWRGHRGGPASSGDVAAIPEPTALLFFGVGLLVARRAIGATWH